MEQGTIEKIWENETRDGKPYWVLKIDGERYSAFDEDAIGVLHEGDHVGFQWKQAGKYRNLAAIKRCRANNAGSANGYDHQLSIVRMSCLKSASELLASYQKVPPERRVDMALEWARRFEEYVLRTQIDGNG